MFITDLELATGPVQAPTTGNPSTTGITPTLSELLTDYFHDPIQVENYRRALRSWFAAFAPNWSEGFGPFNLEGNWYTYEVMDELLSVLTQQAAKDLKS